MQMMHILNFARPPLGSNNCKKEGRKENTLKNFKNNLLLSITDEQFYNLSQSKKRLLSKYRVSWAFFWGEKS